MMNLRLLTTFLAAIAFSLSMAQTTTDSINTPKNTLFMTENQEITVPDSLHFTADSATIETQAVPVFTPFKPNPTKSVWYGLIFPGMGQIYNRKYWKLPIVYGGAAALTYAISWNGKYYSDYSRAYRDIMDSDPNTKSYESILPYGTDVNSDYAKNLLRQKTNSYRRYRDLSIIGAVAFYALTVIDAYVDAQLSDFDISPDLSLGVQPQIMQNNNNDLSVGVNLKLNF